MLSLALSVGLSVCLWSVYWWIRVLRIRSWKTYHKIRPALDFGGKPKLACQSTTVWGCKSFKFGPGSRRPSVSAAAQRNIVVIYFHLISRRINLLHPTSAFIIPRGQKLMGSSELRDGRWEGQSNDILQNTNTYTQIAFGINPLTCSVSSPLGQSFRNPLCLWWWAQ